MAFDPSAVARFDQRVARARDELPRWISTARLMPILTPRDREIKLAALMVGLDGLDHDGLAALAAAALLSLAEKEQA